MAVTVFDDALTILRFGIDPEQRPNEPVLETARSNTQDYVRTAMSPPASRTPPPPDLNRLRDADVPIVSDGEFTEALEDLAERRRELLGVVEAQRWQWSSERQL